MIEKSLEYVDLECEFSSELWNEVYVAAKEINDIQWSI